MNRVAAALGAACALLLIVNLYVVRANARLERTLVAVTGELSSVRAELDRTRIATARQVAKNVQARTAGEDAPARPRLRSGATGPVRGERDDPNAARLVAVRAALRSNTQDKLLMVLEQTGQAEGWDPALVGQGAAVLEDSFLAGDRVRESAKAGEMPAEEARDELLRLREQADADLEALLGPEAYNAFRDQLRVANNNRER